MATNPFTRQLVDFQKQVAEFQKSAFDSTFNAIVALQDQQRELLDRLVDQSSAIPAEAKEALEAWTDSLNRARDDFKSASDKSWELFERYLDRLKGTEDGEE